MSPRSKYSVVTSVGVCPKYEMAELASITLVSLDVTILPPSSRVVPDALITDIICVGTFGTGTMFT